MGRPLGPPCAYEHPRRGAHTNPEGVGKWRLFFSYRTVSLRLPGSHTNPFGVGNKIPKGFYYVTNHPPKGGDNETFNAHTRVSCYFGLFEPVSGLILRQGFGQNCGQNCSFFSLTGSLRGRFNPNGVKCHVFTPKG